MQDSDRLDTHPPLRRVWTVKTKEYVGTHRCVRGVGYFTTKEQILAVDLETGQVLWSRRTRRSNDSSYLAASDSSVYALIEHWGRRIVEYDLTTGRRRWTKRVGFMSPIACVDGCLVAPWKKGSFACIDARTRKLRWLSKAPDRVASSINSLTISDGAVIVSQSSDSEVLALDLLTGEALWQLRGELCTITNGIAILRLGNLEGRAISTGEMLWRLPFGDIEEVCDGAGCVLLKTPTHTSAIDAKSGELMWRKDATNGERQEELEVWQSPRLADTYPVTTNGRVWVVSQGDRIYAYELGPEREIPDTVEEKRELARSWVADFDYLDDADLERLSKLGEYVVAPLIEHILRSRKRFDRSLQAFDVLRRCIKPAHTNELIEAHRKLAANSELSGDFIELLGRDSDPNIAGPYLLSLLKRVPVAKWPWWCAGVLNSLCELDYEPGIDFACEIFRNPKLESFTRDRLRFSLARSGEKGAQAVRTELALKMGGTDSDEASRSDIAKAVAAAFAGQFGSDRVRDAQVTYPSGHVYRWGLSSDRDLVDDDEPNSATIYANVEMPPGKEFDPDEVYPLGVVLKIEVSAHYGPLSAFGNEVYVKKYECGWVAVLVQRVWVS